MAPTWLRAGEESACAIADPNTGLLRVAVECFRARNSRGFETREKSVEEEEEEDQEDEVEDKEEEEGGNTYYVWPGLLARRHTTRA